MTMRRSKAQLRSARLTRVSQLAVMSWLVLGMAACADQTPFQPDDTVFFDLVDGGTTGDPRLMFLPPLAPNRPFTGTFDAAALPRLRVDICKLNGVCSPVRSFDSTNGLAIPAGADFFQVEWHTAHENINRLASYRISVKESGVTLGYVDVVRPGGNVVIKFRVTQSTAPQLPDLAASIVAPTPTSLVMGQPLEVSASVANSGPGSAGASTARFAVIDAASMTEIASATVSQPALAAGASATLSASFAVPYTWPTQVIVTVTTDAAASVIESDESNNSASAAVALISPFTNTWIGVISSAWNHAGNWSAAAVPNASDKVHVPAAVANMPVLSGDAALALLYVAAGATLDLGGSILTVTGDLSGAVIGSGTVNMSGSGAKLEGSVPNLDVTGSVVLSNNAAVTAGDGLLIVYPGAALRLNGHTMSTTHLGVLIRNGATDGLIMQHASDVMVVSGTVTYDNDAGATAAAGSQLSAGTMRVSDSFSIFQNSSPTATFVSTGTHVAFIGSAPRTVQLVESSATGNRFATIETAATAIVDFATDLYASGSATLGGAINVSAVMTIGGNLTLQSGTTLTGAGTVRYAGSLFDLGATINGPAVVKYP